jgi:hypothetical protein
MVSPWAQVAPDMSQPPPGVLAPVQMPDQGLDLHAGLTPIFAPMPKVTQDQNPKNQIEGAFANGNASEGTRLRDEGKLQEDYRKDSDPWGSPDNHPGFLGKLGHVLSTIGNVAGDVFAPATMERIPGTQLHREGEEQGLVKQLNTQAQDESENAERNALTGKTTEETAEMPGKTASEEGLQGAQASLIPSEIEKNQATTESLKNPFGKLPGNEPVGNSDALNKGMQDRYQVLHPRQPLPPEFSLGPNATKNDFDRIDKLMSASETATGSQQQREQSNQIRTAMLAMARERLNETEAKGAKPTADEQRRADLSDNLTENLDALEGIIQRRPELFGPLAGRWTELRGKFGSDDADIGALQTIEHQIGMAQISAHGMRSAMGIQGAADSIMNHLHSSPGAMLGAINAARKSVQTFRSNAEGDKIGPDNKRTGPPSEQGGGTVTLRAPDGSTRDVPADQAEHYKSLGATEVKK